MKLLAFDYETTSNKPQSTRGVQLAALVSEIQDGTNTLDEPWLVMNEITNPEVDIHHEAASIHGITPEMVADKRPDYLASQDLYDFIEANQNEIILCTQNGTTFDVPILARLAQMNSDKPRPPLLLPHIDTFTLATRLWPTAPSHKLSLTEEEAAKIRAENPKKPNQGIGLIQHLGLGTGLGAHDALEDIRMVMSLTKFVREKFKEGEWSFADLARWCATPRVLKIAHFGKHKGKPWGRGPGCVPSGYVHFICEKFEDTTPDMAATIRYHYGREFDCNKRSKSQ